MLTQLQDLLVVCLSNHDDDDDDDTDKITCGYLTACLSMINDNQIKITTKQKKINDQYQHNFSLERLKFFD